jgi:hypothetical protein
MGLYEAVEPPRCKWLFHVDYVAIVVYPRPSESAASITPVVQPSVHHDTTSVDATNSGHAHALEVDDNAWSNPYGAMIGVYWLREKSRRNSWADHFRPERRNLVFSVWQMEIKSKNIYRHHRKFVQLWL